MTFAPVFLFFDKELPEFSKYMMKCEDFQEIAAVALNIVANFNDDEVVNLVDLAIPAKERF